MTLPLISNRDARRTLLHLQGLCTPPRARLTKDGLRQLIERIGFVQIDSIRTVERAHDMILFARNQTYRPKHLKQLLEHDGTLFEHWTHDASIVPSAFYPYWKHRFDRERLVLAERWKNWGREGFEHHFENIIERIQTTGPCMARELEGGTRKSGDGWWDWKPSKAALEYLWRVGELAVARREGFQKVYDLPVNVIADPHLGKSYGREDFIEWACASALQRLGFATHGEIAAFWDLISPAEARAWCEAQDGKALRRVCVESADGSAPKASYARADYEDILRELPDPPDRLRVLSPFDPVIRDRKRALRLFNFDYRIEIFVPEAKRKYGYYVFPLLEGDRLIGRIDMKHDRASGELGIKGFWLEPGVKLTKGRSARLAAELERIRRFSGADSLVNFPVTSTTT